MILHVRAIEADDVPKMDIIGKSDPYIIFTMSTSSQKWKTKYKNNTHKPIWNEQFAIPVTTDADDILKVTLYDYDTPKKSDTISTREFPISQFIENKIIDDWFDLQPVKGVPKGGRVRLAFHYAQPGVTPFVDIYQEKQRTTDIDLQAELGQETQLVPELEPEPEEPVPEEPVPEEPVKDETEQVQEPVKEETEQLTEEIEPVQKDGNYTEFPEQQITEDASQEAKEEFEWNHNVREITKAIKELTDLRAINFCYVDRLINVTGKNRLIACYLRPLSSELSENGVFIYDTTRLSKNRALYLFVGPKASAFLEKSGEKLLNMMVEDTKCETVFRIIRTKGPEWQRMIHQMGGSEIMVRTEKGFGDPFFFENQFFKTLLHIFIFTPNNMEQRNDLNFDELPPNCAAVIDTSDLALYLYVDHVEPTSEEEKQTQLDAIHWMGKQPQYKNRELLVFDKSKIPTNLKILFCK